MLCSIRSLTGAILFGSSGDGVRARLKFDTATPMMKIIEEQQDRVKNQPLYWLTNKELSNHGSEIA